MVVNEHTIVLGRLGPKELASPPDSIVEAVMQPGPATVRADEPLDKLLDRMAKHGIQATIVTTRSHRVPNDWPRVEPIVLFFVVKRPEVLRIIAS